MDELSPSRDEQNKNIWKEPPRNKPHDKKRQNTLPETSIALQKWAVHQKERIVFQRFIFRGCVSFKEGKLQIKRTRRRLSIYILLRH